MCRNHSASQHQQGNPVPIMKFATERHSVALMQDIEMGSYSLSSARLPQLKSAAKKRTATKKNSMINEPESSVDTCLAHSSIVLEDCVATPAAPAQSTTELSMEVFAMMRTTEKQDGSSKDPSSTTPRSNAFSEAAGGELVSGRRISTDASTIISTASTLKQHDVTAGENTTSVKFYLMVKVRGGLLEQQDDSQPNASSRTSFKEIIPLDFRPISVHAAALHVISSTTKTSNDNHLNNSSSTAVGIFVASVDDNRLRLFIAQTEEMQSRKTKGTKSDARCFISVILNDTASSPSEMQGLASHDNIGESLVFSTPIMAMDSYVTEEECQTGDREKIVTKVNRLAIACYDGTLRILTYRMVNQRGDKDGNDSPYQFCTIRCSRFIVDGPVVSLQFGVANCASRMFSLAETPSLYLVAGSLCGFVCVFYEALLPPSSKQNSEHMTCDRFFDGPMLVIDGLDDGQQEGYMDCVTSVHVSCHSDTQQIMVGTQNGRVLILQQCDKERMGWERIETDAIFNRQERDQSQHRIDERRKHISQLETEKECMVMKARDLHIAISELKNESDDAANENECTTETVDPSSLVSEIGVGKDLDAILEDPHVDESVNCVGDEANTVEPSFSNNNTISDSPTSNSEPEIQTATNMAHIKLASLEQNIAEMESKISELSADLVMLERRRAECAEKAESLSARLLHSINLRKLHRYEILREYQFPYPIHGIDSSYLVGDRNRQEFVVTTMKSIHVRLIDKVALAEEKSTNIRVE